MEEESESDSVGAKLGEISTVLGVEDAPGKVVTADIAGIEIEVGVECCEENAEVDSVFLPGEKKFESLLLIDGLQFVTSHTVVEDAVVITVVESLFDEVVGEAEDDISQQYFFHARNFFAS